MNERIVNLFFGNSIFLTLEGSGIFFDFYNYPSERIQKNMSFAHQNARQNI